MRMEGQPMAAARAGFFVIAFACCWPSGGSYGEVSQNPFRLSAAAVQADRPAPVIITRQAWGAKPALPGMTSQLVTGIILHNTGVRKNPGISLERKMRGLQDFSQNPGEVSPGHTKPSWPDVPYHFYVDAAGRVAEGRDTNFAGDTNTSYDTSGFIQIVVEGDFENEVPGTEQISALRDLLAWILRSRGFAAETITVHKDHASTDCPGRNFMAVLPGLLAQVKRKLASASNRKLVARVATAVPDFAHAQSGLRLLATHNVKHLTTR